MATESHDGTGALALNLGLKATSYYFDNIQIAKYNEEGAGGPTWDLVSGADFEMDDASNYEGNSNAILSFSADGAGE